MGHHYSYLQLGLWLRNGCIPPPTGPPPEGMGVNALAAPHVLYHCGLHWGRYMARSKGDGREAIDPRPSSRHGCVQYLSSVVFHVARVYGTYKVI